MKLREYLLDRRYLFLFYFILMIFISLVVYLDPSVKINLDNIIYINLVSFVFLIIYFMGSYLYNKRYYSTINYIIENFEGDIINSLPEPKTHKQYLYNQLFKNIYQQQNDKGRYKILKNIGVNKKEIKASIAKQMLFVFLLPLVVGIFHSLVAISLLDKILDVNLVVPISLSVGAYTLIYMIYYVLTVNSYTKIVNTKV